MASFNQSPLGQTSIGVAITSVASIGSSADTATTITSTVIFANDGSSGGPTFYPKITNVVPSWRRSSKVINVSS